MPNVARGAHARGVANAVLLEHVEVVVEAPSVLGMIVGKQRANACVGAHIRPRGTADRPVYDVIR